MLKKTENSPLERYVETDLPDFRGLKALVLDGAFKGSVIELLARSGFQMAKDIKEADLVVFVGGADVNPNLYGEKNVGSSYSDARDAFEVDMYAKALEWDVPMYGICRGLQFLHVMNGGRLWQHVNNHGGSCHDIVDTETGLVVKSTSIHHQMLRESDEMTILAVTNNPVATQFRRAECEVNVSNKVKQLDMDPLEIEAACWIETKCFGVQGHPELIEQSPEYSSWCMHKLAEFLEELANMNGDNDPIEICAPNFLSNSVH